MCAPATPRFRILCIDRFELTERVSVCLFVCERAFARAHKGETMGVWVVFVRGAFAFPSRKSLAYARRNSPRAHVLRLAFVNRIANKIATTEVPELLLSRSISAESAIERAFSIYHELVSNYRWQCRTRVRLLRLRALIQ